MALYTTGNGHTFRGRNLLYTPVILNRFRNEWDKPSMKGRVRLFTMRPLPSHSIVYLFLHSWQRTDLKTILSCTVFGSVGEVDRANWYIIKSHPLFLYPGDWRTANALGQCTDMKCFLPPIQNLGKDNIGTFFHPVSKAGKTRGGCS